MEDNSNVEHRPGEMGEKIHNEQAAAVKALRVQVGHSGVRKGVVCGSFQDVIGKCREKFGFNQETYTVTLEDGTQVDDEFFSTVGSGSVLILILSADEEGPSGNQAAQDQKNSSKAENSNTSLMALIEKIQKKKQSGSRRPITLHCGWMNFLYREDRYQQVKSGSLGGSVPLKIFQDDTYHTVLEKLKDKFFPDGKNEKGTIKDFDMELGTAKKKIEKAAFTVGHYCRTAKVGRARIYLLTKRKQPKLIGTSSSSDESDDFLLPPPWRTADRTHNLSWLDDVSCGKAT